DQGGFRVDGGISSRQQVFGEIFVQNSPSDQPGLYPLSGLLYSNKAELAMLQHTWTVSPHAVNTARVAFVRSIAIGGNEAQSPIPAGFLNTLEDQEITAVNLQGYSSFGRSNGQVGNSDNTWHLDDGVSFIHGDHTFKFGAGLAYR